jgi:ATP-binding cassette subfamily F protein 3
LILLDEVTNHLDLQGMNWLIQYLTDPTKNMTVMVVSHDRSFLGAVCTDTIVMAHQKLTYYVGNYWDYERTIQEKTAREAQMLDASDRQRQKAMEFIQKQQQMGNKKSADPNKQRQAKTMKDVKMDRIGMYREDGKKFKTMSLKKLDMNSYRGPQKVYIERDDPIIRLKFPDPDWKGLGDNHTMLVQLEDVSFSYNNDSNENGNKSTPTPLVLDDVTLNVTRSSKVALVGRNGCGKSTLIKLIMGDLKKRKNNNNHYNNFILKGKITQHPNVRIGYISQHSAEELDQYSTMTLVEYGETILKYGRASSQIIAEASGNVRQYLGAFGLGNSQFAYRTIQQLSGGERMRVCFATVLADEPHILLLDESTNHVDLETLDSLSVALNTYSGAVIMVSHNQGFLSGFCNTLWVLEDGRLDVLHNDTDTFDALFSQYRSHVMTTKSGAGATAARSSERKAKADMVKRATRQSTGTAKAATFIG